MTKYLLQTKKNKIETFKTKKSRYNRFKKLYKKNHKQQYIIGELK